MKTGLCNAFASTMAEPSSLRAVEMSRTRSSRVESHSFQQPHSDSSPLPFRAHLSAWSRSGSKRAFDCACVLLMLPLLIPILLAIALAVRLTSAGPVLFLQKRMGRHGRIFTIVKFRTIVQAADKTHQGITTSGNQAFTQVGPFLRRWKLDELPQVVNVLAGHMSLVGPRPKIPEHAIADLQCRAGITGAATIAFAREEAVLALLPERHLSTFYHSVALPAKHTLDTEYMAQASLLSDLKLIFDSVLRRWESSIMESLLANWASVQNDGELRSGFADQKQMVEYIPIPFQQRSNCLIPTQSSASARPGRSRIANSREAPS